MRSLTCTVATATLLALAFPQTPLAQDDGGVVGRTLRLDGGPSANRGQGGRSESTEQSADARSDKSQTTSEKTSKATIRGSQTHIGSRSRSRHLLAIHLVAFNGHRHGFVIHRHGRRFVAFNEPAPTAEQ
jgi:hypothetical protein